jgi:hypothetical protein
LTARIAAKLPELMAAPPAAAKPATAADSFFGEADALDSFDGTAGSVHPPATSSPGSQGGAVSAPYEAPMGVPKSGGNMMLFLAVGGGALVVGVLIAVVLVLLN